jgi:hypothetical protein
MVVWCGFGNIFFNTGSRYDPATDTWLSTATTGAPACARSPPRRLDRNLNGGMGRPRPANALLRGRWPLRSIADAWLPVSNVGAPSATNEPHCDLDRKPDDRVGRLPPRPEGCTPGERHMEPPHRWSMPHAAVWPHGGVTGSKMIVWGRQRYRHWALYDPVNDNWTPTATLNAPAGRSGHSAVWTGSLMIVWGGGSNTGGRYDPVSNTWTPTSTTNTPSIRGGDRVCLVGTVMIVWGGSVFDPSANP